jgi:hypothetical protein
VLGRRKRLQEHAAVGHEGHDEAQHAAHDDRRDLVILGMHRDKHQGLDRQDRGGHHRERWPAAKRRGNDEADGLEPNLMRSALPLLEEAVETGEAEPRHLALLVDRIRTLEGRPQRYGTSHDWDANGELSPLPIEEPELVEARRRAVGLEPLAENTRRLRLQAGAESEKPPVDAAAGSAQTPAELIWGRDYTFERTEATRVVDDDQDKGTIRLATFIYRPVQNDRKEVVLFSHGSTGGLSRSPKEPAEVVPQAILRFFNSRGYTLVAPHRRGRGESTGTYVEECSVFMNECTSQQFSVLGARALREALADTNAVIDQIILGKLVPRDSKILAAGISRGGFLSLMHAGERPASTRFCKPFPGNTDHVCRLLRAITLQDRSDP